jgi:cytochrome c-type biogenesis protein CcmH
MSVATRWASRVAVSVPSMVLLCLMTLGVLSASVQAVRAAGSAAAAAGDPAVEARVQRLGAELRCLVCQNQTVADSSAGLAEDLRREMRTMIARGDSDRQILDFMTARYGDFVLYRPPVKGTTMLLWAGPALLLVAGVVSLGLALRRRVRLSDDRFEPEPHDPRADDPSAGREGSMR